MHTFAHGDHFSWQAQGKPRGLVLQSRFFVIGARDRNCFTSSCNFRGRRGTLEMVVIVEEIRFRDRYKMIFGYVARLQSSWQAQHSVTLDVQISWQAQRLVNLEMQIS